MTYYDRQGDPMTMEEWGRKHADFSYKVIKQESVSGHLVSTVWMGIDHRFTEKGAPLIFETMIFDQREDADSFSEDYCERYSTEDAALAGHDQALAWLRDKLAQEVS